MKLFSRSKRQRKRFDCNPRGNLAPEGSVVKYSACEKDMRIHKGTAKVYNREEDAYQAVVDGKIEPGDVIVVRYEGPRGSGMPWKC